MNVPRRPDKTWLRRRPRRLNLALGVVAAGTILLALLTLSESATQAARAALGHSSIFNSINKHLNPFRTRHALYQSGLPVYDLKIESAEYRGILNCVEQAKKRGFLSDDLKRWSKATFIHRGVARKVKIRVRGDGPNHWAGVRKSWRIRFRKDESFEGQREFNLILPTDGKGVYERFTNAVFARLGMMTLRDGYAVLRINGIPQGVYYQTEHWDEALLAHHQRPEGTIFANPRNGLELGSFREQVTDADEAAQRALQLLLDYELNPTPPNFDAALAVTNVDDYLRFVAGTTLFSSDHTAFTTDNHKLYYDPSRGQFYRIPWDIEPKRLDTVERFEMEGWHSTFDVFARWPMSKFRVAVLQNDQLRWRRNQLLWSLVRDDSLNELFKQTYEDLERALWCDVMAGDRPEKLLDAFRRVVARNVKHIRKALAFSQAEMRVRREQSGLISLQVAINCMSGIVVDRLTLRDAQAGARYTLLHDINGNGDIDSEDRVVGSATADGSGTACFAGLEERLFPEMGVDENYPAYVYQSGGTGSRYKTKPMRTVVFPKTSRFDYLIAGSRAAAAPRGDEAPVVEISAVNAVTDRPLDESQLLIRAHAMAYRFDPLRRRESRARFLKENPAFRAAPGSDQTDTIVLPRGTHEFRETVVVPEGMTLVIEAGADIAMGARTSLVCFGPIRAEGTKDAPIRIHRITDNPDDKRRGIPASVRAGEPWGTLASVRAGDASVFRFVHLEGGQGDTVEGIRFTGALAVHDGDVVMEDCRITRCPAEDGINFKNGNVTIRRTYFADNASDAMDLDFVQGDVVSSHFERNGGDAIDFSGSTANVLGNRIERSGDKGISVGEASDVRISNNLLLNNVIGVAVKDRSQARIDHCTFLDNDQAVAVYRKKPIFGGAKVDVGSSILLGGNEIQSIDRFSTIHFVNSMIPEGWRIAGCTQAPPNLEAYLRSQEFVLAIDHQPTADAASPATGDATRPGLVHPPVDLR